MRSEGVRAVRRLKVAAKERVTPCLALETRNGVFSVLCSEARLRVPKLRLHALFLDRIRERAAVPQKLGVLVLGVAHSELAEGRRVLSACGAH